METEAFQKLEALHAADTPRRLRMVRLHPIIFREALKEVFPSKEDRLKAYIQALQDELVCMENALINVQNAAGRSRAGLAASTGRA